MEGPEYLAWLEEDARNEHTLLMGATTYRLMSGFATDQPDDPGLAGLTAMPKAVFSSTLVGAHLRPVSDVALDLVERRAFDGRLQLLEYVPTVLDGPPGVSDY